MEAVFRILGFFALVVVVAGMILRFVSGEYPDFYYPAITQMLVCIGVAEILSELKKRG